LPKQKSRYRQVDIAKILNNRDLFAIILSPGLIKIRGNISKESLPKTFDHASFEF
jgi:hypothetical protein